MTTVELVPLLGGEVAMTARFEIAPPGPLASERSLLAQILGIRRHLAPVPAFLIRHPAEGDLLVDAAYDPSVAFDPVHTLGPASGRIFEHRPYPLRPQLAALDAEPGMVVATHLHNDHVSGIGQFRAATLVCDQLEWEAAHRRASWLNGYVPSLFADVPSRRLLDLDAGEPHGVFARTIDLFGDGSVRIVSTRGHSPGHCSVIVRTPSGEVLLCADACGTERQLHEILPTTIVADRTQFFASLRAIQAWLREDPARLAVPGHDPGWTERLRSGQLRGAA